MDPAQGNVRSILSPWKGRNHENIEHVCKALALERLSGRNSLETRMDIGHRMKDAGGYRP